MDFDATTVRGLLAAALTTAAFRPQVIKTWRTRQTRDISLGMLQDRTSRYDRRLATGQHKNA